MKPVAIIPARGGSKRLPRKNILPLEGKPLLARVIDCCFDSQIFEKVIVTTEDMEIASIARECDATVHLIEDSLARDRSTVVEVCEDVLASEEVDDFCCIYATAALLNLDTLRKSYSMLKNNPQLNVVMGVSSYNYPPVQALKVDDDGNAELLFPEYLGVQSQFQPKTRVSNGTFYWGRRKTFLLERTFYSHKLGVYEVPESEVCDLDTAEDYDILRKKFEAIKTELKL